MSPVQQQLSWHAEQAYDLLPIEDGKHSLLSNIDAPHQASCEVVLFAQVVVRAKRVEPACALSKTVVTHSPYACNILHMQLC